MDTWATATLHRQTTNVWKKEQGIPHLWTLSLSDNRKNALAPPVGELLIILRYATEITWRDYVSCQQ
jgi:hypothetical protein